MFKNIIIAATTLMVFSAVSQEPKHFDITYIDDAGIGVLSEEDFTKESGEVLKAGAYRKELIEYTARAVSLQFKHVVTHKLELKFDPLPGFLAITLGPAFSEYRLNVVPDVHEFLQVGRHYPSTLRNTLLGVFLSADYDGSITFADSTSALYKVSDGQYPRIVYSAYHEFMHLLGFVDGQCLGGCFPEPSTNINHFTPYLFYNDKSTLLNYEALSLNEKNEAYKSIDELWFGGTDITKAAAMNELTSGHSDGYIYMYATPTDTDDVDGQSGSHFSFDVQPAQLMHSAGAMTEDLGMAAYLLCDIGWCQGDGKVIEQSTFASINDNASTETETVIDITIAEHLNVGVDEFELFIRPQDDFTVLDFQSPGITCEEVDESYHCKGELMPLSEKVVTIIAAPNSTYSINGELRSTGYDVDRNGFNNILDTVLQKEPETVTPAPAPPPATVVTPTPQSTGSGGGSISLMALPLVFIALIRRLKKKTIAM